MFCNGYRNCFEVFQNISGPLTLTLSPRKLTGRGCFVWRAFLPSILWGRGDVRIRRSAEQWRRAANARFASDSRRMSLFLSPLPQIVAAKGLGVQKTLDLQRFW